jgi:16S rRNA (cytosine967-C5)-methyltransferase
VVKLPSAGGAPTARSIAARVIGRVLYDGAYLSAALDGELSRAAGLDPRERGLATEISYGVLRTRGALERELARHAKKPPKDEITRLNLLVAAYQILLLERVPAFAAVNAAVSAVRAERGPKLAGFANAVLRKLAAGARLDPVQAVFDSGPAWLIDELNAVVGRDETARLLGAFGAPSLSLRLLDGRPVPEWIAALEPGRVSPRSRRLQDAGDPRKRPGYSEGSFLVQEEGAQVIALLLGARPGERVLDACAGRGQKTSLFSEAVGATGSVWASDLHARKLDTLKGDWQRLALPAPSCRAVDLSVGVADLPDDFERVLVDAPCTGTGTLARRPEIRERLTEADPARLAELQLAILERAATRVRPGGRLVYAVCSVLEAEAEQVIERAVRRPGALLERAPFDAPELEGRLPLEESELRLLPGTHGTDGYFVASLVRKRD